MVNNLGQWTEEKDYTNFPKGKRCDYDEMAILIRQSKYEIRTTMENLINMIFLHFEGEMENTEGLYFSIDNVMEYVNTSGGFKEFDYFFINHLTNNNQ